jgi:hypothetical protein
MLISVTIKHTVCGWQCTLPVVKVQKTALRLLRTYSRGRNKELGDKKRENSENRAGTWTGATLGGQKPGDPVSCWEPAVRRDSSFTVSGQAHCTATAVSTTHLLTSAYAK